MTQRIGRDGRDAAYRAWTVRATSNGARTMQRASIDCGPRVFHRRRELPDLGAEEAAEFLRPEEAQRHPLALEQRGDLRICDRLSYFRFEPRDRRRRRARSGGNADPSRDFEAGKAGPGGGRHAWELRG